MTLSSAGPQASGNSGRRRLKPPEIEGRKTGTEETRPAASGWRRFLSWPGSAGGHWPHDERRSAERRSHSAHSFLYGSFRPRRRNGRRSGDHNRVFLDWHEPHVLYLVLAILLLSCVDALFTLNLLALGAQEMNVLMDMLIVRDVNQFIMVKIGMTAVAVSFLAIAARRHVLGIVPVIRVLQAICAGYVLLIAWELYLFVLHLGDLAVLGEAWDDFAPFREAGSPVGRPGLGRGP